MFGIKSVIVLKKNLIANPSHLRFCGDEATDFHSRNTLKADSDHICCSLVLTDYIFIKDENYYPQMFFKKMLVH